MQSADAELLQQIYASTREQELANWPMSAEQKAQFLQMQFRAQHTHYAARYADASCSLVELDGQPIGRLYVLRTQADIHLVDISLLPAWRSQGWGTALIQGLLDEARGAGVALTGHVARDNRARNWYARLGFIETADLGAYVAIAVSPGDHSPQPGHGAPLGAVCPPSPSNLEKSHVNAIPG